jgi:orotidine-5'-phosphate decarboxylase
MKTFTDRLMDAIDAKKSILCAGLDPQFKMIPTHIREEARIRYGRGWRAIGEAYLEFNKMVIDAVEPYVACVKPQMAFYEAYGNWGVWAFEGTVEYAKDRGLVVIEDAKREDGDDTAQAYADGHIGRVDFWGDDQKSFSKVPSFDVDAITVTAWIGQPMIAPFVEVVKEYGKGVFVVDKTSFRPDSVIQQKKTEDGRTNWEELAHWVLHWGVNTEGERGYRNLGVVMGATYSEEAATMRRILPNAWFLIPGYGAQGGGADGAVVGFNKDGYGGVVNSSRGIIFAYAKGQFQCEPENFAEAARQAAEFSRDDLNAALKRAGKCPW